MLIDTRCVIRYSRLMIKVSGNWRLTFAFEDNDAYIVNYEDYQ